MSRRRKLKGRVVTKTAPRNKQMREVPFMGLNVADVFADTSGHNDTRDTAHHEAERIRLAREKRARRRERGQS